MINIINFLSSTFFTDLRSELINVTWKTHGFDHYFVELHMFPPPDCDTPTHRGKTHQCWCFPIEEAFEFCDSWHAQYEDKLEPFHSLHIMALNETRPVWYQKWGPPSRAAHTHSRLSRSCRPSQTLQHFSIQFCMELEKKTKNIKCYTFWYIYGILIYSNISETL